MCIASTCKRKRGYGLYSSTPPIGRVHIVAICHKERTQISSSMRQNVLTLMVLNSFLSSLCIECHGKCTAITNTKVVKLVLNQSPRLESQLQNYFIKWIPVSLWVIAQSCDIWILNLNKKSFLEATLLKGTTFFGIHSTANTQGDRYCRVDMDNWILLGVPAI